MKNVLFLSLMFFSATLFAQNMESPDSEEKVIVDNEKMKVIEHVGLPSGDVCGTGIHHHKPHLTVVLTNAKVKITPENGEPEEIEVKSGTSLWFGDAEKHSVINIGNQPTKMILVYLKE